MIKELFKINLFSVSIMLMREGENQLILRVGLPLVLHVNVIFSPSSTTIMSLSGCLITFGGAK